MNTVDNRIVNEAKIACYADDIAIWHSHTDILMSENVLNENLFHIEDWAKQLKLLINPEKTKYCVFSTDRRNRAAFLPKLRNDKNLKIKCVSFVKSIVCIIIAKEMIAVATFERDLANEKGSEDNFIGKWFSLEIIM
ncbi:hypothetical protein TNCT_188231 [Trichonephila clavata]|uniref:Reverse transcriptase domain-containing protein n=1 Tax=Trichonephila clavata TaxID=2740835 RepID=A0A8X6K887_TRICU|nr:hypothetical protein TNCT_188231 [Trichonephila clavata]